MKKIIFISLFFILNSSFLIINCFGQWEPDVRLTNNPAGSQTSYNNAWCIAANGNVVHIVWMDDRDGYPNSEIYYKRSTDGGVTWGADTRLTNNGFASMYPSIAISGSNVHVVWQDYRAINEEIYYKHSTDGGITWGADTRLTSNTDWSQYPSIAVSGTLINVVWEDNRDGNDEIYYKRSTDGGIIWGADTRLTNATSYSWSPSIAVFGSFIHVVWSDNRDGDYEIYYKLSTDGGLIWGTDTRLTNNSFGSFYPSIAVSGTLIHVVWHDDREGNWEIYYKRSSDGGINWGADTRLTNNTANSGFPSIAVSGTLVHTVWRDYRDGNYEIYYKRSTDWGINWGADTRLTNDTSYSEDPSIAVSGTLVHVVWDDTRDGNYEIYYKRNPTGNVGIKNISTEIPSAFSLEQNYPNPFNSMTNVKFKMLNAGNAVIKVFDISGKDVATLVNEKLQPGKYSVLFDAGNLTSGIYFYRLQTENFIATKSMILLK